MFLKYCKVKVKFSRYRPKSALGESGRLRLQIFWYSFLEAESTSGHMVPSVTSKKNPQRHNWRFFFFGSLYFHLYYYFVLIVPFHPYCATHTTQTSMPPAEFEPAIPTGERLQTHALDRSATGIDPETLRLVAVQMKLHWTFWKVFQVLYQIRAVPGHSLLTGQCFRRLVFTFDYVYELKCSILPLLIRTVLLIYLANPSGSWPAVSSIYIIIRC